MLSHPFLVALLTLATSASAAESVAAPATVQWQVQELSIVRRVAPAYPSGVALDAAGDVACRTSVRIAGDGAPVAVAVEGCPAAFAQSTERAIQQWRWSSWNSVAERRVTMTVRFPQLVAQAAPTPAAPTAPALVARAESVR